MPGDEMRQLLLLRHAKSSWDVPGLDDFDRPLNRRGIDAAPRMGALMAERGWLPERVLVSTALRTRQTWDMVSPFLGKAIDTRVLDELYLAPAHVIARLVAEAADADTLLVIGHNPGLEEFAGRIAGPGSDPDVLAVMGMKFPTAGLARFEFDDNADARSIAAGRLTHFLRPADLA
jgi:phosphohistidine phosphatase